MPRRRKKEKQKKKKKIELKKIEITEGNFIFTDLDYGPEITKIIKAIPAKHRRNMKCTLSGRPRKAS